MVGGAEILAACEGMRAELEAAYHACVLQQQLAATPSVAASSAAAVSSAAAASSGAVPYAVKEFGPFQKVRIHTLAAVPSTYRATVDQPLVKLQPIPCESKPPTRTPPERAAKSKAKSQLDDIAESGEENDSGPLARAPAKAKAAKESLNNLDDEIEPLAQL